MGRELPSALKLTALGLALPRLCARSDTAAALRQLSLPGAAVANPAKHSSLPFLFSAQRCLILGIQVTPLRGNSAIEQVRLVTQDFRSLILMSRFLYQLNPEFPPTGPLTQWMFFRVGDVVTLPMGVS